MRHHFLALLSFLLLLTVGPACAALLGDARVAYSADRTVTVNGRAYTGKMFHMPGHQRHEQEIQGLSEVVILDGAAAQGWLVLPGLHSYVEFHFPTVLAELEDRNILGAKAGQETVDGVSTTKYRVDHRAADGSRVQGFVWLSRDGVMMKLDGTLARPRSSKPTAIRMELSQLRLGPQDPGLFALPPGLVKLPSDALAPLLGGRAG